jgi:hypothetical protein
MLVCCCFKTGWSYWSYRMRREEDQVMAEHASPNDSCQDPRACLCYDSSAFVHGQLRYS